ncbi:ABC transporter ATP-binding protein [Streptomyces hainanensis]|uniref:ABC transporter ATP-binding protein n=1 Tax=Streptomyces hainanensis TaxID=402648 RepID=A0A4R4SK06_9ACTN|nr:ABC transporter ATP-binding protein [Streptomyces hainanensis]TDC63970.1 ABC transporter ATP-binding protein [Streptomyces hainanensis]
MSQPTATDPDTRHDVVLRAEHLDVVYEGRRPVHAVRDVSLELRRGEILGIAGESGCGSSTLASALGRMLRPPARLVGGRVTFRGRDDDAETDLTALAGEELHAFRRNRLSVVFPSAMNALNPVTTVGRRFDDIFRAHRPRMGAAERRDRARELLSTVGVEPARVAAHPHDLSGGTRQRVVIAMALALDPEVVVLDEPTTGLDAVVRREILDEIVRLRDRFGFGVVLVTHDLAPLLELSDRLAVMYAGRVVEHAPTARIARGAAHPYTRGLLRSFPGRSPDPSAEPPGCAFVDRCPDAFEPCAGRRPAAHRLGPAGDPEVWTAACHLHAPPPAGGGRQRERRARP